LSDINEIHDKLVSAGDDWADKDAAATLLEETKKTVLAQLKTMSKAGSDAARETEALASEGYQDHVRSMVDARKAANRAKVAYESRKTWVELWRTKAANERAEMTMR
jgi:hypothetical protein